MADKHRSDQNAELLETSFLDGGSALYLEQMQAKYADNPSSVPESWRKYFASLDDDASVVRDNARGPGWKRKDWPHATNGELTAALTGEWPLEPVAEKAIKARMPDASEEDIRKATQDSVRALMLIRAYRIRGHLEADLDPLGLVEKETHPELEPATYGFTEDDWDRPIFLDHVLGLETATLRQIMDIVKRTYCGHVGVQFMHISNPEEKSWVQERIEGPDKEISFTPEGKIAILKKLTEAEAFEGFLQRRYPGTKRFGIDGGEALVPALEQIIKVGGHHGVKDIVIGMPHRGRLNVLGAVMAKPYEAIFYEFLGGDTSGAEEFASSDVKYHLGASSDRSFDGNDVHLSLVPNPSHLEAVDPVVLGKARATQTMDMASGKSDNPVSVLPLLLHGDAAFAGQGMVSECFALSGLKGYRTAGTIHFVVNNQIGFTTSPSFSRSSPYPSDVALMVQAPIFHANGDDPESVVYAARLATEYRQRFGKDAVVDMFCYRRYGHNEGDDPSFTQPIMYKKIKGQPSTREIYAKRLIEEGLIDQAGVDKMMDDFTAQLEKDFEAGENYEAKGPDWLKGDWEGYALPGDEERRPGDTDVKVENLKRIGEAITHIPEDSKPHRTLKRIIGARREAIESGENIDWALAEHLAFGSLLDEGFGVRLSGQDSGRGTFSQRHSHIVNQENESRYTPLNHIREGQAHYEVIDSLLSEEAVLGFEYGYSIADPKTLTLWEAQFGDFANGAQVIMDQFISSAERKWLRMSGLVMLLPHGYEGQGPEHSSARLERYLQLCAQDNMQVVNCTTPANYFHVLRRQIHRNFRKPLVVMTPKSLLRHKKAVSTLAEMGEGSSFHRVLWDDAEYHPDITEIKLAKNKDIRRVIMCSGKVYYDLLEERDRRGINDVYLLRLEQLYPLPRSGLSTELKRFKNADMVWCQEEPHNMGAWSFINPFIETVLTALGAKHTRPRYVGRPPAASTATGLMSKHKAQLEAFMNEAFAE